MAEKSVDKFNRIFLKELLMKDIFEINNEKHQRMIYTEIIHRLTRKIYEMFYRILRQSKCLQKIKGKKSEKYQQPAERDML